MSAAATPHLAGDATAHPAELLLVTAIAPAANARKGAIYSENREKLSKNI
jgi:hypothetical protein